LLSCHSEVALHLVLLAIEIHPISGSRNAMMTAPAKTQSRNSEIAGHHPHLELLG